MLAKIAEMPEPERAMAKRLHEIIKASALVKKAVSCGLISPLVSALGSSVAPTNLTISSQT